MGATVSRQAMGQRQRSRRGGVYGPVGGLVCLILIVLVPVVMGQSAVSALLTRLNLSDYSPRLRLPPFKGWTSTGQEVSLADLEGQVVLVNFWASWCAECRPEMPMFERLHRDFAAQGLSVVGINFREKTTRVQQYAKTLGLTFPLVLDPQGEMFRSYGVIGLPTTFLIARDGRPVALAVGPRPWDSPEARALIQALLAEPVVK